MYSTVCSGPTPFRLEACILSMLGGSQQTPNLCGVLVLKAWKESVSTKCSRLSLQWTYSLTQPPRTAGIIYKMFCVYVHSMTPITVQLYRGVRAWKRSIFKKRRQLQNIIYLWSPTTVYTKSVMCEGVEGDFWIVKIVCWLNPGRVLNLRYSHQSSLRYAEWFFLIFRKKTVF